MDNHNSIFSDPERTYWINIAKVIGIYLMILGHVKMKGEGNLTITNIIFAFHMPLFFFLSGLVHKQRPPKETLKRCMWQIIVPYVLWYFISYFWWLAVSFLKRREIFGSISTAFFEPMAGLILGVGFHTDHSIMVSIPLWFLPGIFCVKMLSSITAHFHENMKIFIMVVTTIFALVLWHTKWFLPISLGSAFMCFPIYYAGILFRKNKSDLSKVIKVLYSFCRQQY